MLLFTAPFNLVLSDLYIFYVQVKSGTKMGLVFEVAEGGFLGNIWVDQSLTFFFLMMSILMKNLMQTKGKETINMILYKYTFSLLFYSIRCDSPCCKGSVAIKFNNTDPNTALIFVYRNVFFFQILTLRLLDQTQKLFTR